MCGARRRLWVLGTIALLFCGTRAWAGPAASVTLAINPATTMTNLGANFNVAIEVQAGAQQVDGAAAHIDFDQSILQVVSITAGSSLPVLIQNTFSNAAGTVDYSAGNFLDFSDRDIHTRNGNVQFDCSVRWNATDLSRRSSQAERRDIRWFVGAHRHSAGQCDRHCSYADDYTHRDGYQDTNRDAD